MPTSVAYITPHLKNAIPLVKASYFAIRPANFRATDRLADTMQNMNTTCGAGRITSNTVDDDMRTMRTITRMTVVRQAVVGIAVMLSASGGSLLASGALASAAKPTKAMSQQVRHKRSRLNVFAHPLSMSGRRARIASASVQTPPGAVLAAVSSVNAIYAWQPTAAEETTAMQTADNGNSTCVVELLSSGLESIGCGSTTEVEGRGLIGINMPSKDAPNLSATALVPNGVTTVTVTDNDRTTYAVPVSHNAVIIEDPNLAAVSYKLPNGRVNSATVGEVEASRK